ncbi:MAG: hypothetical protein ABS916_02605 [Carnobacterium sp.]
MTLTNIGVERRRNQLVKCLFSFQLSGRIWYDKIKKRLHLTCERFIKWG